MAAYWSRVGLSMSHSAIFQLYSDGTVVQFSKFKPAAGIQRPGQLGILYVLSLSRHGPETSEDVNNILAFRGPTYNEGLPRIELGSPDPQSSPQPLRHRGGNEVWRESLQSLSSVTHEHWALCHYVHVMNNFVDIDF